MFGQDNLVLQELQKVDQARVEGHNRLAQAINQMSSQQAEIIKKQQIDILKDIVTHTYSRSASYTQLIMVAGYAVFFTVWAAMRNEFSKTTVYLSGFLVTMSVMWFVMTEVYKMVATGTHFRKLNKKIFENPAPTVLKDVQTEMQAHERRMFWMWVFLFIPSLVTGVSVGLLILVTFANGLINELMK